MPAVHAKTELAAVQGVRGDDMVQARVGGGKGHISVMSKGVLKIVRAAEIVLGARAAYGGVLRVLVRRNWA